MREQCAGAYAEVIVVDNASTDGTPELIATMFPEFKLIRNAENLGFAKANNIGIEQSTGDYICLVNSDVKFINDSISMLSTYLHQNPTVAMVGPKMLAANGEIRRSTMRFPTVWNYFCRALGLDFLFKGSRLFGGLLMSDFDHRSTRHVEVLNGWFVMARRSALERVGLLDGRFFMYGEDIDWCYRFSQAGLQIVFCADAEAIHYGGASSANAPLRFHLELFRADWQLWRKHHGWLAQAVFLAVQSIHHAIRIFGAAGNYLLNPSNRPKTRLKLQKSIAALKLLREMSAKEQTTYLDDAVSTN